MTKPLPILTDEEVSRIPADEEAGFGALATARGNLPLQALDVRARLDGLLAQVTLSQTFVNPHDEPLEATYLFPLPDRAAVTHFRMEVAGRVVEGVLKERGQARRDYDQAIQSGHRAAITEEERPGVFTLRVGNLMPAEEATVRLTLSGPLAYSDGEAVFRFPLVVAPRYIPGAPLPGPSVGDGTACDTDAVPDASRISPPVLLPGFPNPVRLALAVDVAPSPLLAGEFRSSLHAVLDVTNDEGVRRILLQPGERLNRDFILRFRLGQNAVQTALTLRPDEDGSGEGTFALTLVPPAGQGRAQRPRDVVFVLDRSGSMGGWKMVAARRALARMVETLTEGDRFAVYAFDDRIETPPGLNGVGLSPAGDRNRFRAVEFLGRVESRGGTEMAQPLDLAVHTLAGDASRDRVLVLVTDGQVGNEDQILHNLGKRIQNIRIFTLGIDQAVNAAFLNRLAALGGGACELVESEDRLAQVMDQVHRHIGTPVLTDLRLEAQGFEIVPSTLVPGRLPDLFAGTPLCLLGRYRGPAGGSLLVRAGDAAGRSWSASVEGRVSGNEAAASVWARGHIRELEDRFVIVSGDRDLERRIVATSLQFGVLCRFTAFVAVDRAEVVNEGGQVHQATQPVELPAGWEQGALDNKHLLGPRAAKKTFLAKQVLQEFHAGGRVSPKTQLALEAFRGAAPPPSAAPVCRSPAGVPPPESHIEVVDSELHNLRHTVESLLQRGPDMVTMGKLPQTPRAEKVIEFAVEEARDLNHSNVDTEHLLLGLLREQEGVAAQVLTNLGLTLEDARVEVCKRTTARGKSGTLPEKSNPYARFTDRARKVMQSACQEAQRFNHEYVGTEHILLGLIREGSGLAAEILRSRGMGASGAQPNQPGEGDPLAPYRCRAREMLEALQSHAAGSAAERVTVLMELAVQLAALVRDLKSTGLAEDERKPLEKLLGDVQRLLAQGRVKEAKLSRLWSQAEEVLQRFVGTVGQVENL
jgi:Ca-activated chloride channel family protein